MNDIREQLVRLGLIDPSDLWDIPTEDPDQIEPLVPESGWYVVPANEDIIVGPYQSEQEAREDISADDPFFPIDPSTATIRYIRVIGQTKDLVANERRREEQQ